MAAPIAGFSNTSWLIPEPAMVAKSKPINMRPLARWCWGNRKNRTAMIPSTNGSRMENQPKVPATMWKITEPTMGSLAGAHQNVHATMTASSRTKNPVPSRRSSTGMTTSGPIFRTAPPKGVEIAAQKRIMARTTQGWEVSVTLYGVSFVVVEVFFDFEVDFFFDERSGEVRVAIPPRLPLLLA